MNRERWFKKDRDIIIKGRVTTRFYFCIYTDNNNWKGH